MKFTQLSTLKNHQRYKHTFEKPFECTDCEMKFTTNGDLKAHQRHKHTFGKPFKCNECEMNFTTRSHLKRHKLYKQTHQQVIDLNDFDNKIFEKGTLLRCQRRTPSFEKPYKCYFCFKQFFTIVSRKLHKQSHTGV